MLQQVRGDKIDDAILRLLIEADRPMSTLEISRKINVSWHPVTSHCLKLQVEKRISGFKLGRMNVWQIVIDVPNVIPDSDVKLDSFVGGNET